MTAGITNPETFEDQDKEACNSGSVHPQRINTGNEQSRDIFPARGTLHRKDKTLSESETGNQTGKGESLFADDTNCKLQTRMENDSRGVSDERRSSTDFGVAGTPPSPCVGGKDDSLHEDFLAKKEMQPAPHLNGQSATATASQTETVSRNRSLSHAMIVPLPWKLPDGPVASEHINESFTDEASGTRIQTFRGVRRPRPCSFDVNPQQKERSDPAGLRWYSEVNFPGSEDELSEKRLIFSQPTSAAAIPKGEMGKLSSEELQQLGRRRESAPLQPRLRGTAETLGKSISPDSLNGLQAGWIREIAKKSRRESSAEELKEVKRPSKAIRREYGFYCTSKGMVPGWLSLSESVVTFEPDRRSVHVKTYGVGEFQSVIPIREMSEIAAVVLPRTRPIEDLFNLPNEKDGPLPPWASSKSAEQHLRSQRPGSPKGRDALEGEAISRSEGLPGELTSRSLISGLFETSASSGSADAKANSHNQPDFTPAALSSPATIKLNSIGSSMENEDGNWDDSTMIHRQWQCLTEERLPNEPAFGLLQILLKPHAIRRRSAATRRSPSLGDNPQKHSEPGRPWHRHPKENQSKGNQFWTQEILFNKESGSKTASPGIQSAITSLDPTPMNKVSHRYDERKSEEMSSSSLRRRSSAARLRQLSVAVSHLQSKMSSADDRWYPHNIDSNNSFESLGASSIDSSVRDQLFSDARTSSITRRSMDQITNAHNQMDPKECSHTKDFLMFRLSSPEVVKQATRILLSLVDACFDNDSLGKGTAFVPHLSNVALEKLMVLCADEGDSDETEMKQQGRSVQHSPTAITNMLLRPVPPRMECPEGASMLLNEAMSLGLSVALPPTVALRCWNVLFDTSLHGISMRSFYSRVEGHVPAFILVLDENSAVFGGYSPDGFRESRHYYGTGETIVFKFEQKPQDDFGGIKAYTWSGKNNLFVYSDQNRIFFGGGGRYALAIDHDLLQGTSSPCSTFDSDRLSQNEDFSIQRVQVWGFH